MTVSDGRRRRHRAPSARAEVVVEVVVVVVEVRASAQARAQQRARSAVAQELQERQRRRQLGRRDLVEQLARLSPQDLARRLAGCRLLRGSSTGSAGWRDVPPGGNVRHLDLHVIEPGLDVEVQQLRSVGEPPLALGREGQKHVLESPERPLAVDRDEQPLAQRLIGDRARRTAPSSGTARATTRGRPAGNARGSRRPAPAGRRRPAPPRRSTAGRRSRGRGSSPDPENFARTRSPDHSNSR